MIGEEYAIQGKPIRHLAERFGTPLYVYDASLLVATYAGLRERLDPVVDLYYSAKANPNVSICAVMRSLGAGIEVSSMAEMITARQAGVAARNIVFVGPGKSADELRACADEQIGVVVCESLDELAAFDGMSRPESAQRVLLRINPAFTTTGARLAMGGKPRQFGIDQESLLGARSVLRGLRRVQVAGIHVYMGTRILDAAAIAHNTRGALAAAEELSAELGFALQTVDVGGGLGIAYFDNEKDLDVDQAADGINAAVTGFAARHPDCRVIMELGRFLVGRSGMYVVRARYVKQSKGEWFVITDGGMHHHMAAVGAGSFVKRNFPVQLLTRYTEPADRRYTITGPLCTPDDVLAKRIVLPEVRPGDLLGVERSGAYGPTSSPVLFLSHGYPAEVLVIDGAAHLVRRRDTVEDLLRPQHLVSI